MLEIGDGGGEGVDVVVELANSIVAGATE